MIRRLAVLRPEPGNAETAARVEATGLVAVRLPLFAVRPIAWQVPDPDDYAALLLTSANAVRHAGAGLGALAGLPVVAVGAATAEAARAAGLRVVHVGTGNAAAAIDGAGVPGRLLHLAGRERAADPRAEAVTVYASEPLPVAPEAVAALAGGVVLLHSARAARRFDELRAAAGAPRRDFRLAAIAPAVLVAAGEGWAVAVAADRPDDAALIERARAIAV